MCWETLEWWLFHLRRLMTCYVASFCLRHQRMRQNRDPKLWISCWFPFTRTLTRHLNLNKGIPKQRYIFFRTMTNQVGASCSKAFLIVSFWFFSHTWASQVMVVLFLTVALASESESAPWFMIHVHLEPLNLR